MRTREVLEVGGIALATVAIIGGAWWLGNRDAKSGSSGNGGNGNNGGGGPLPMPLPGGGGGGYQGLPDPPTTLRVDLSSSGGLVGGKIVVRPGDTIQLILPDPKTLGFQWVLALSQGLALGVSIPPTYNISVLQWHAASPAIDAAYTSVLGKVDATFHIDVTIDPNAKSPGFTS